MKNILIMLMLLTVLFTGCTHDEYLDDSSQNETVVNEQLDVSEVKLIDSDEARKLIKDSGALLVDVRTKEEYEQNHIEGAMLIPLDVIDSVIEEQISDKETNIILYCRSGRRSGIAAELLLEMGYKNIYDMGAISSW